MTAEQVNAEALAEQLIDATETITGLPLDQIQDMVDMLELQIREPEAAHLNTAEYQQTLFLLRRALHAARYTQVCFNPPQEQPQQPVAQERPKWSEPEKYAGAMVSTYFRYLAYIGIAVVALLVVGTIINTVYSLST